MTMSDTIATMARRVGKAIGELPYGDEAEHHKRCEAEYAAPAGHEREFERRFGFPRPGKRP